MFSSARRSDGDFRVSIICRANVNDVDERRLNDFLPVRGGVLPAELRASGLGVRAIAAADRVQFHSCLEREKVRCLPPCV